MKKRFLAMAMMIMLLVAAMPVGALAESETSVVSGEYDTATGHISWEYDTETKTLTLNGTGAVAKGNYAQGDNGWINLGEPGWALYFDEIEHVVIGEGITNVAYNGGGFTNCTTLETVVFPNSLNSIEDFTFTGCKNLREINLPKNLESIGYEAFADCDSCTSVVIPASVKYIGKDAFVGWTKYDWIYYEGDYPICSLDYGYSEREIGSNGVTGGHAVTARYFEYSNFNNKQEIIVFYKADTTVANYLPHYSYRNQYEYMEITELEGWIEMREQWRLFEDQKEVIGAEKYSGWTKLDGKWYYYKDNKKLTGMQTLEGYQVGGKTGENQYRLLDDGSLFTGFRKTDDGWTYYGEAGSSPKTSALGQLMKDCCVKSPKSGYISESEQAVIDSGRERVYYYYFDENGIMYTGWHKDELTQNRWRYFGEDGKAPWSSRVGRRYSYGKLDCYGYEDAEGNTKHTYFFSQTGSMMTGENSTGTYCTEGTDPTKDALGSKIA